MLDGTRNLLHLSRCIKQIHLVILLSHFIWHTTSPRLDLVQLELFLVVSSLTYVDLLVCWKSSRTALVVSSEEHDEAAINDFFNLVVTILTSLHNLVFIEVLLETMDSLFWPVIPASINPLLAFSILPCAVDLGNNRLGNIILVREMNPISHLPELAVVEDLWQRKLAVLINEVTVGFLLFLLS
jgi:hypothetical protein